jgi:hypothetical protein
LVKLGFDQRNRGLNGCAYSQIAGIKQDGIVSGL